MELEEEEGKERDSETNELTVQEREKGEKQREQRKGESKRANER